jgi:hypothetical protein
MEEAENRPYCGGTSAQFSDSGKLNVAHVSAVFGFREAERGARQWSFRIKGSKPWVTSAQFSDALPQNGGTFVQISDMEQGNMGHLIAGLG